MKHLDKIEILKDVLIKIKVMQVHKGSAKKLAEEAKIPLPVWQTGLSQNRISARHFIRIVLNVSDWEKYLTKEDILNYLEARMIVENINKGSKRIVY